MRQDAAGNGEHRGSAVAVHPEVHVPRCVDAAKAHHELAARETAADRSRRDADGEELPPRHDARLSLHERADDFIRRRFAPLCTPRVQNCANLGRQGDERVELGGVEGGHAGRVEHARVPSQAPVCAESAPAYSGMLPCLRLGCATRLVSSVSSAVITFGRVSCGTITSSMYPRSAAEYGLAKRAL